MGDVGLISSLRSLNLLKTSKSQHTGTKKHYEPSRLGALFRLRLSGTRVTGVNGETYYLTAELIYDGHDSMGFQCD